MKRFAGVRVEGTSIAGIETSIHLPELGVIFDMGCCSPRMAGCSQVFLTHGHVDHCGAVAKHASLRLLNGLGEADYHAPESAVPSLTEMFNAFDSLSGHPLPRRVVPVAEDGEVRLRRDLVARAFRADHRIPSQGYVLFERRERLREEFEGRKGEEIARLRANGETVTRTLDTPLVAFSGDTRIEAIERNEPARKAKLLILEATYLLPEDSVELARERGHVHLDEIIARADMFENEAILLTHFSARYSPSVVRRILAERLPASLAARTHAWLDRD